MSAKNVRVTRSKNLADVTNCTFSTRSKQQTLKKRTIVSSSSREIVQKTNSTVTSPKRKHSVEKIADLPKKKSKIVANGTEIGDGPGNGVEANGRPANRVETSDRPGNGVKTIDRPANGIEANGRPANRVETSDRSSDDELDEKTPMAVYIKSLRGTLTDAYCDMSARLKLTTPPKCVFNLQNCNDQHFKNAVRLRD